MKKLIAVVLAALGIMVGSQAIAGAAPVPCPGGDQGWYQSGWTDRSVQCTVDYYGDGVKHVHVQDVFAGDVRVTTVDAWIPGWTNFQMVGGAFGSSWAQLRFCNNMSGAGFLRLPAGGTTWGWETRFERTNYDAWGNWYPPVSAGDMNHYANWGGSQTFGGKVQDVGGICYAGLGSYLTVG